MAGGNAGALYLCQGNYEDALTCFELNLAIAAELNDWASVLAALGNIALVFAAKEPDREAEALLKRAVDLGRELDQPHHLCQVLHRAAELYMRQGRHAEAQVLSQEALTIATELKRKDIQFEAQVLAIRLQRAQCQIDMQRAIAELERLRARWPDDPEQAWLDYEIWQIDPGRERERHNAAQLYQRLYAQTPNIDFRERYGQLTGQELPEPPDLPPLPSAVTASPVNLPELLPKVGVHFRTAAAGQEVPGSPLHALR